MGYLPLAVHYNKIYPILLAFNFKELQIICKPRHTKCFQAIFQIATFFPPQFMFLYLARLGLMSTCKKNTILYSIFEPTFQFVS